MIARAKHDRQRAALLLAVQGRLSGGEAGDGDSEGGAAYVIEADLVAEGDRGRVAAVLAADAALQAAARLAAFGYGHFNELANSSRIERLEGIAGEQFLLEIVGQKRVHVVAAEAERHLREVVGAEAEEVGRLADLVRGQRGTRNGLQLT